MNIHIHIYIFKSNSVPIDCFHVRTHNHCGQIVRFFKGNNKFIYSDKIFRSLNFDNQFKTIKNDVQAPGRSPCPQLN